MESNITQERSEEEAQALRERYEAQLEFRREEERKKAKRDMIFGALWCVGGTVATIMSTKVLFWGAIVFGGIQFFRGLLNYD